MVHTYARGPLEALIAAWLRQRVEINLLRDRLAGRVCQFLEANPFRPQGISNPTQPTGAQPSFISKDNAHETFSPR